MAPQLPEPVSDPIADDIVGLLEGMSTTRSIRRYTDEKIPPAVLRDILFAATRAPSGSNRQPFRFVVLDDGPVAAAAKNIVAEAAQAGWSRKRRADGYDSGSGVVSDSPKSRMARSMERYVAEMRHVPVLVFPCLIRKRAMNPTEGASIYPACQNLLLAARALGYGGALTMWHHSVESELRELIGIPDDVAISATITLGRPEGSHGPVRRLPMPELVFAETWGRPAPWAIDPPGVRHTSAGPPIVRPPEAERGADK